ncbi:MAG: nuclease [Myxococcota bacterium]
MSWDDGDTFSYRSSAGRKIRARLRGYNTLESYGPVHRWGEWTTDELYANAKAAAATAASRPWSCQKTGADGGYGRVVVDCPELREALLREGLAHAFWIDEAAPAAELKIQAAAIAGRAGMWSKGAPQGLITSLHSGDEKPDAVPYNRICDLQTGACPGVEHDAVYESCAEVCLRGSCMVYVPFARRYRNKAECLRR